MEATLQIQVNGVRLFATQELVDALNKVILDPKHTQCTEAWGDPPARPVEPNKRKRLVLVTAINTVNAE